MKKLLFVFAVIFLTNQSIFAQNDPKVTIQISPFLPLLDAAASTWYETQFIFDLEGQFRLTKATNISLTLSSLISKYADTDEYTTWDEELVEKNIFQMRLKPMFIYRPFEKGLKGFYIGYYLPSIGFLYVSGKNKDALYTELGLGLNLGYKWIFRSGFTMQLGGGVGKTFSIPEKPRQYLNYNSDGSISTGFTDVLILDFKLGYSF